MSLKMQNLILKYLVFIKTSKIQKKILKKMFYAYGQVSQKLKNHIVFFIHQKTMF